MTVGNMESAGLFDAGKKGRGLRATKELNTGEVIFAESSFSAVVFDRYEANGCCRFRFGCSLDGQVGGLIFCHSACLYRSG